MPRRLFVRLVLAFVCAGAGHGVAEAAPTAAQQQAIRSSCQADYRSYCASVPTGGSAALQCLQKNVASLSPSCQQAVQAAGGSGGGAAPAAPATTAEPATPAEPAQTQQPNVIVIEPGQAIALMRQACGADYRAHCAGVRIIGGGALACLVSHAASLSPSCKGELSRLGQRF